MRRADGTPRNATDLLTDPANTLSVTVNAPNNSAVYGSFAGRSIPYVVVICHPTSSADPRSDYPLPTGRSVPHMQSGSDAPLWPDATTRYPVLIFSHGYRSSPLSNDHLYAMTVFASFGYVVAAPFHADATFSDLKFEDLGDAFYLLTHLENFLAMQALRPLALSATIDLLLARPPWRDRVDGAQIGGFGASMGGESLLLTAGAGLTTSIGQSWTGITKDTRLKAAATYMPYFGQVGLPAFGRGQHRLDGVTLPFFAISGTADTTAPIPLALEGVARLAGTRELVALSGVEHGFDVESTGDIFTWTLAFLDAEVRGDPAARAKLSQMTSVAGGGDDHVLIPYNGSAQAPSTPLNFGGLWWNSPGARSPAGASTSRTRATSIFATWFTYGLDGKPLVAVDDRDQRRRPTPIAGNALQTAPGRPFDAVPFDPAQVTLRATSARRRSRSATRDTGAFAYTVDGVTQTKAITRQVFAQSGADLRVGARAGPGARDQLPGPVVDAPAGSESGWGINFTHQGDTIFATWFTYDLDGKPLWLVGGGCRGPPADVRRRRSTSATGPRSTPYRSIRARSSGAPVGTAAPDVHRRQQRELCVYGGRHRADQSDHTDRSSASRAQPADSRRPALEPRRAGWRCAARSSTHGSCGLNCGRSDWQRAAFAATARHPHVPSGDQPDHRARDPARDRTRVPADRHWRDARRHGQSTGPHHRSARALDQLWSELDETAHIAARAEFRYLERRRRLASWAINFCTGAALLVCLVIVTLLVEGVSARTSSGSPPRCSSARCLLIGGLTIFLREVYLATHAGRFETRRIAR